MMTTLLGMVSGMKKSCGRREPWRGTYAEGRAMQDMQRNRLRIQQGKRMHAGAPLSIAPAGRHRRG
jgi:hypothetical protein